VLTTDTDTIDHDWLTVPDIAGALQSGTRPIYRAIDAGELRAARINERGDLRVSRVWLTEWLEKRAARLRG
jgi:excisionase family DNA binding protein